MNKKIYLITILLGLFAFFASCSDDDDNTVTDEWKNHQQSLYQKVMNMKDDSGRSVFEEIKSLSGQGNIFVKDSDYITKNEQDEFDEEGPVIFKSDASSKASKRPIYDTDVVEVRYEGWYYNLDNKKVVFDSTEKNVQTGKWNNNKETAKFTVNGVVDGFKTLLQNMEVGEEKIVCMPYQLGYLESGDDYGTIPGYTTLFFDVKLLKNVTAEEELQKQ